MKAYEIRMVSKTPDGERRFELCRDGEVIMTNSDARVLSNYAFADGAVKVRWDFDLKLAEK